MKSIVSLELLDMFPEYVRGVVIARNIDNNGENEKLLNLLRQEEKNATNMPKENIKNHPRIAPWRETYLKFGSNPNKYNPSVESLYRRAQRGNQLPYINTAVALFNYFSLKHIVPSGADDVSFIQDDLCLTIAKGDEEFIPFNSDSVEHPDPGEVVYVCNSVVMCRRWNWRQGNQTKLETNTTDIVINVDCLPPVTPDEAETLTAELAELVKEYCQGEVRYSLLDIRQNEVEI
jgi:DNA/RNA-binding domain of Phe-tRNA-synthetase-like protein